MSSALWAGIIRLASVVAAAVRDVWLVHLGRRAAEGDQAKAEAEARARQAQAAADSPDTAADLAKRLRDGEPL